MKSSLSRVSLLTSVLLFIGNSGCFTRETARESAKQRPESLDSIVGPLNPSRPITRRKRAVFPPDITADIVLGGLFPVHSRLETAVGQTCGELSSERGVQRLEAMIFAIEEVNKNTTLLPNLTLGALIHDTCGTDTIGLEETLEFIMDSLSRQNLPTQQCSGVDENFNKTLLAGVIGAASSSVSIQVANLLRLFKMPQISYASTSPDLSNKHRYDFFMRTVPSDAFQARVIRDVIRALNWSAVFTVNSKGNYGERGIEEFHMLAKEANICVVEAVTIEHSFTAEAFDDVIRRFMRETGMRGVVLFCTDNDIRKLLNAAERVQAEGRFSWIASDYWGTRHGLVKGRESLAKGAITITLRSIPHTEYREYFTSLTPTNYSKANPWFEEFWEKNFKCKLTGNSSTCPANTSLYKEMYIDNKVPFVIDAVRAFATGLDVLYRNKCPNTDGLCEDLMRQNNGEELMSILQNISFQGVSGEVKFDSQGDATGMYDVFTFNQTESGYNYIRVATWDGGLHFVDPALQAGGLDLGGEGVLLNPSGVQSSCGEPCSRGYYRKLRRDKACCWTCLPCGKDEYVKDLTGCGRCTELERPDPTRTGCVLLPLRYLSDSWSIMVTCFATVGIICVLGVSVIFIMFSETPLVKASGRELTATLLIGLFLCYVEGIMLILRPSVFVCGLQRFGVGFAPCVCYAALLIKTNRIARIFAKSERSTKPPDFINPASQLLILAAVVGVEVVLAGVGLGYWSPKQIEKFPTKSDILSTCNIQDYDLVVAMSYNVLLILLCTMYAFRTRKTPANFNEARYIGFAMYTTCVIWLALLPVQIGVNDKDYKTLTLSINVTLNATTLLLCVFGPKVYIVLFRPTRNIRSRSLNVWRKDSETQSTPASGKASERKSSQFEELGVDNLAIHVKSTSGSIISTYL
ncbi:metabotropic glutamate receptor 3 isoform X2 [Nematostella vectensis]|uniref:metabotropic glutamate receptor 3 isoform X2 n=1 Tax=Nematostella vectensis TaxID=45351 RepID=UPI002077161B|nr:metabotropic glutamate receptor 3 isoform X2 [Nematostella vectensis]